MGLIIQLCEICREEQYYIEITEKNSYVTITERMKALLNLEDLIPTDILKNT